MYIAVGDDVDHTDMIKCQWMDWVHVDARPFLLYLQYLTYGSLRVRYRQLEAFHRLKDLVMAQDKISDKSPCLATVVSWRVVYWWH